MPSSDGLVQREVDHQIHCVHPSLVNDTSKRHGKSQQSGRHSHHFHHHTSHHKNCNSATNQLCQYCYFNTLSCVTTMEPSISLEPCSNTTVIFSTIKPFRNVNTQVYNHQNNVKYTQSTISPPKLQSNKCATITNTSPTPSLETSTPNPPTTNNTLIHQHQHHQQTKEELTITTMDNSIPHQVQHNENTSNDSGKSNITSFSRSLNGSEDEKVANEYCLKRKGSSSICSISPSKKRCYEMLSKDGENYCKFSLSNAKQEIIISNTNINRSSNNVNNNSSSSDCLTVLPTTTTATLPPPSSNSALNENGDSSYTLPQVREATLLDRASNTSSPNQSSDSSLQDFEFLDENDPQYITNSSTGDCTTSNNKNLFENVEFFTPKRKSNRGRKPKPKKVNVSEGPWTEEEHELFIQGYNECGKNWSKIADEFVPSRSRTQIASHAQKWFRKHRNKN